MRISSLRGRLITLTVLGCLAAGGARAQEFRATITGPFDDPARWRDGHNRGEYRATVVG